MPDVEHIHPPLPLVNAVDHAIDMRLISIQQVAESRVFRSLWTALRVLTQAQDGFFQASIPFERCVRMLCVNLFVEDGEVSLRPGRKINEICHAWLRSS